MHDACKDISWTKCVCEAGLVLPAAHNDSQWTACWHNMIQPEFVIRLRPVVDLEMAACFPSRCSHAGLVGQRLVASNRCSLLSRSACTPKMPIRESTSTASYYAEHDRHLPHLKNPEGTRDFVMTLTSRQRRLLMVELDRYREHTDDSGKLSSLNAIMGNQTQLFTFEYVLGYVLCQTNDGAMLIMRMCQVEIFLPKVGSVTGVIIF